MTCACDSGRLTTGVSARHFAPHDELTRGQLATFFARLYRVLSG